MKADKIYDRKGNLLAQIIPPQTGDRGIEFFTGVNEILQLGYLRHEKGKIIPAHIHLPAHRESNERTAECLFVRSGSVEVDFYGTDREYVQTVTVGTGAVVLLLRGGHGFKVVSAYDAEIFEVKLGPYIDRKADKEEFKPGEYSLE